MQTRLIVYAKVKKQHSFICYFAVWSDSLVADLGEQTFLDLASQNRLVRHDSFDWSVGDAGARCTLLEAKAETSLTLLDPLQALPPFLRVGARDLPCRWLNFPQACRALPSSEDRRYLQLAVQFVAAGERIEDSVLAAPTDPELIQMIKESEQNPPPEEH